MNTGNLQSTVLPAKKFEMYFIVLYLLIRNLNNSLN